jgi:sulfur carrier protein ThiS
MALDRPQRYLELEMEAGTTLSGVIELLGYEDQFDNMLVVVNGQIADRDDTPNDGDTIDTR